MVVICPQARNAVTIGTNVAVYHYIAAGQLRMQMARFFGEMCGRACVRVCGICALRRESARSTSEER